MKGNEALAALWEALEKPNGSPPPNAITASDVSAKFGIGQRAALDRLKSQVKSGALETAKFTVNGHPTNYYWLPEKKVKRAAKS